jgi:hypothetical protein
MLISITQPIILAGWRAPVSACLMINKQERSSLMARWMGDDLYHTKRQMKIDRQQQQEQVKEQPEQKAEKK